MAKTKKADERRKKAKGLDRETFEGFIATVKDAKQEVDDAQMAHAGAWKNADKKGVHPEAAKLYCRLDKMEDAKRADFLRSFDQYREWAEHWSVQPDMFEEDATEAGERADREEPPLDLEQSAPRERTEPLPDTEAVLKEQEEADPVDETPAEATEELANAGFTFAEGKAAGLRGDAVETNPHPEKTPSHPIWARGHAQGTKEKAEADAGGDAAGNVVTPIGNRRSRRPPAAEETSVSVH